MKKEPESKNGRPPIAPNKKKQGVSLTLDPKVKQMGIKQARKRGKSLSEYVQSLLEDDMTDCRA